MEECREEEIRSGSPETSAGNPTEADETIEKEAAGDVSETDEASQETPDAETDDEEAPQSDNDAEPQESDGQQAEEDDSGDDAESDDAPKRGLFGRKKKDKRDQQIEELTDRVQRQMAEFDNFRKRSEKEKAAMYEVGAKSVIEKILPAIDNFERGFGGLSEEQKQDPFVQGMEKVYRQMLTTLEAIGVKPIEAVGKPFDPNFHNAVMHVEDEEAGENTVVEEFQKGYLYRDSVVRHTMVKVAN